MCVGETFVKTGQMRLTFLTPSTVTQEVDSLLLVPSWHQHLPTREPGEIRDGLWGLQQQPCPWSSQGRQVSWLRAQEPRGFPTGHSRKTSLTALSCLCDPHPQTKRGSQVAAPGWFAVVCGTDRGFSI